VELSGTSSSETAAVQLQTNMAAVTQFVQGQDSSHSSHVFVILKYIYKVFTVNIHILPFSCHFRVYGFFDKGFEMDFIQAVFLSVLAWTHTHMIFTKLCNKCQLLKHC